MSRHHSMFCVGLVALAGCSSSDHASKPGSTNETYLGLETPTDGFQVRDVGTTIPPGADLEFCEVAELPGTPSTTYYVSSVEMANGQESHHLIISISPPGSPSDAKLRAMNIGDRVPCLSAQIAFGEDIVAVGGIQHPYGKSALPPGIAEKYQGGSRVVFDYHFYNTTNEPVQAKSAFNFHLTDASKVKQLAGGFGFYNWTIDTPPGAHGSFTADCRLESDAIVGSLTRHTHKWGRDFSTWYAGGAHDGELVWTTPDFNTDTDHVFDEPVAVNAGEGFKFQCTYENTETYPLRFGVKATDEMCILFGAYWDAHGGYEPPAESCSITWIDADGIGRPASYPGAFPPPDPALASACLGGAPSHTACTECSCNSCADVLVKCFTDKDCAPIVQCFQGGGDCQSIVDQHSPGVGMAQQVSACVQTKCGSTCQGSGSGDGGATANDGGAR
jgi:hypothetical protein